MSYMMTSESDDGMDSSTYNESPAAGRSRGKGSALKKGPWTSAEDRILIGYVKRHGEGNWNAVQRFTSLSRCGKSCRLRWANHLRPNLKKGAFSPEEEHLIVEMHAKIGNKWAQMADHLPGRTDNEIKNYWNTRIKRRKRAGLPLYPPDILVEDEDLLWSEEYTKSSILRVNRRRHHDFSQLGNSKADVLYDDLNFASSLLPGASDLSDLVACNMLETGACASLYESYMPPILPSPKPLQESGSQFPMCSSNIKIEFQSPEQFQNTASPKNSRSCSISPCDVDHLPYGNQYSSDMMISESHTFTDGMLPTSKPSFGAVKLELPSFQYSETGAFDQWKTPSSSPQSDLLDSVDAYILSPPPSEIEESDCFSSCNTGLLDMLLYEAKIKKCAKHSSLLSSSDQSFGSTTCRTVVTESVPCARDTQIESGDFENYQKNLARSKIPVPMQLNAGNVVVKTEESDQVWNPKRVDITRPDVLLASSWLDQGCFGCVRDSSSMTDALALLLGGDDIGNRSSSSQAPQGVGSCTWTNMSPVWSL